MSLTLFMRSEIPEGIYEWKTTTKQTTRDLNILRYYAFHKGESNPFIMYVPLLMMQKKSEAINVKLRDLIS